MTLNQQDLQKIADLTLEHYNRGRRGFLGGDALIAEPIFQLSSCVGSPASSKAPSPGAENPDIAISAPYQAGE